MLDSESPILLRFDGFELDLRTRELRKDGRLVKMQDLPVKLLALLAGRPGELVTREEIEKALWGEDQFVDFEHGINTAMRKIREALGEELEQPRFIETLPRKGYRFIAPVESVGAAGELRKSPGTVKSGPPVSDPLPRADATRPDENGIESSRDIPGASPPDTVQEQDFLLPRGQARVLFLLIQAGYLAIYCSALYKAESLQEVLEVVYRVPSITVLPALLVLAACGVAVRLYLLTSVGLNHPAAGEKYHRLFPVLFALDTIWAASPLLLVRKLGIGLALAGVATLAYLPFAQRILIRSSYRDTPP
jgi:cholera toxin transcriptional activator